MRWMVILFLSVSLPVLSQADKKVNKTKRETAKFLVSGKITRTFSHCGGVDIGNDAEQQLNTPSPFPGKKIYIKKGEKNNFKSAVVIEITSDDSGKFIISLPPGKYCIVDERKKDETFYKEVLKKHSKKTEWYSAVDPKCLKEWYEKPDAVFEMISSDVKNISVNYHQPCSWGQVPCAEYDGPLPP